MEQKKKVIRSIWVLVRKEVMGNSKVKARLVARGDMEEKTFKVDSPTASQTSRRLVLSIAATRNWKLHSLDFVGAFLQGGEMDREVIIRPPADIMRVVGGKKLLWGLQKPL